MGKRRKLNFQNEADAIAEAESLLRGGYQMLGRWSLAQNCEHLAIAVDYSMDGFPMKGSWLMMNIIGPVMRRVLFLRGRMPAGVRAPQGLRPANDVNDEVGVQKLRDSLTRFSRHRVEFFPSPIIGKLTGDQWKRLHLIHAAHHLSFLIPDGSQ